MWGGRVATLYLTPASNWPQNESQIDVITKVPCIKRDCKSPLHTDASLELVSVKFNGKVTGMHHTPDRANPFVS